MSLLYFDGMDLYDTATMDRRWHTVSGAAVTAATVRTGVGALELNAASDYAQALNPKNDPVSISDIKIGFAFRYTLGAIGSIVSVWDWTGLQCYLVLNATGQIDMYLADGTLLDQGVRVLAENTWYYIEWRVAIAPVGAVWEVDINETGDFSAVTGTTQGSLTTDIIYVRWGDVGNSTHDGLYTMQVDDIYLVDPNDGVWPTGFLGDVRVDRLAPTGDGADAEWARVGQATTYECVDEVPPNDDTDYLFSDGTAAVSTVTTDGLGFKPAKIYGMQVAACNRQTDLGEFIAPGFVSGATYDVTNGFACSFEWGYSVLLRSLNREASTTWTPAETSTVAFGVARDT